MKIKYRILPFIFFSSFFAQPVFAEKVNATLELTMNVQPACSVSKSLPTEVNINYYLASHSGGGQYFTINCTKGVVYNIEIDKGIHGTSSQDRKMKHKTLDVYLPYTIHKENSRDSELIGTKAEGMSKSVIANGSNQNNYIYINISSSARASAGEYSDTVRFLVSY